MSEIGEPLRINPFPSAAVAKIEIADGVSITIDTPAVEAAVRSLASYLRPADGEMGPADGEPGDGPAGDAPRSRRDGDIVAVVGDYGTGKTHLAIHLLRLAQREQEAGQGERVGRIIVHPTYLEASPGGFERLYRDFVGRLDRQELLATVEDYYADVVADALSGSTYTRKIARRLRSGELAPGSVVEGLELTDSLLSRQLRHEMIKVTRAESFGIALTMLLRRKEFADDVWAWLTGAPPTAALVERGITSPIAGEELALEAMGVFAQLYGRRQHRFVLVIDELDKILTASRGQERTAVAGFRKLFEVFHAAGAFLVVVGLPDLFDLLGESVRQRANRVIDMSRLDGDEVRQLIEEIHRQSGGAACLAPFAEGAPDQIAKLTDGTARQVIRLCHRAYQIAIDEGSAVITEETIQAAARTPEGFPTVATVQQEVRRALNGQGLPFEREYWHQGVARAVDFWVTVGSTGAGCAVILTDSVVGESDVRELTGQAREVHAQIEGAQTLLVVVGYLNGDFRSRVTDAFGAEPIEYGRHRFIEDLTGAVTSALVRIESLEGEDILGRLRERLNWMHRQQAYSQNFIERLALRVEEVGTAVGQLPGAVRRELRARPAARADEPSTATPGSTSLPPAVAEVFREALLVLAQFSTEDTMIRAALNLSAAPAELDRGQRAVRMRLNSAALYPAIGVVGLLRELVEAFRAAVTELYDRFVRSDPQARGEVVEERLDTLCHSYEAIYDHLQMSKLDEYPAAVDATVDDDDIEQVSWAARRQSVRDRFDQLGRRVREAALPAFGRLGG
jgi:Cdc6-like AAA superfamily ATPase